MKKKTMRKLIIVLLAVIAIAIGILIFANRNESIHKLAKIYEQLSASSSYLFEMERNDDNKIIMAKKDNDTVIDQYSETEHLATIVKDGITYFVIHDREEYYIYGNKITEQNLLAEEIKEIIQKPYLTGIEKIKGKKYYCEEYEGSTVFIISNSLNINSENIKTRFFFDNNGKLAYIKTMIEGNQELLKVNLQYEVQDTIFEIPSHYAEN